MALSGLSTNAGHGVYSPNSPPKQCWYLTFMDEEPVSETKLVPSISRDLNLVLSNSSPHTTSILPFVLMCCHELVWTRVMKFG